MDTPEPGLEAYEAPRSEAAIEPPAGAAPSLWQSSLLGARSGARRVALVIGPISLLLGTAGLAWTAFGLGAGRGFGVHPLAASAAGMLAVGELYGAILGGVLGPIVARARRKSTESGRASRLAFLSRPIRLLPWRRTDVTSRTRPRRWPWVAAATIAAILTIAFGVGVYAGRYVDRRLAQAISASDRDDPNWRLDDLMAAREPVPDEENSAIVVAEVVSMLPEGWPGARAPGSPSGKDEVAEAADRMAAAAANTRLDDETAATLRGYLDAQAEAVGLARSVAEFRRGRHELELTRDLVSTPLRETQDCRLVARLLGADAAMRAHGGDLDGAMDSCRAMLGVARSIGDEPMLISQLGRIAAGVTAADSARRVLGQGEPSDQALARFQAAALDEASEPLFLRGMRGERAILDEVIRRIRDGELAVSALSDGGRPDDLVRPVSPWGRLWFDHQRAVGLGWMNELVAIAHRPPFERAPLLAAWEAEIRRVARSRLGLLAAPLPALMVPAAATADPSCVRYQASLGATAILLAAERHRRKMGDWPGSIDAIDRSILPDPPVDPFSGKPFLLERRDGQLLIHSAGPNLRDDRGAFDARTWRKGGPDDVGTNAWDVSFRRQPPDSPRE
ncbi:hypothetical protein OJF2_03210 [Aquisphaera giovannonii]|uniref:Uncharacterized protein n=1 Tax=Aquisphaera giovannonii TaxID=406548 RepID=A0A5B9VUU9_9BACT|nr:hypothetical protein [Aquisphaera giovannonii]QEH31854.1 hypothetical protein OJF2_03210 [Aquisphaera giovannonii]